MTGIVTHLSFGMEEPDAPLALIAEALIDEPPRFKTTLKACLDDGYSFAEARAMAAESVIPGAGRVLSSPNNTLAHEYAVRILERGYSISPVPIKRIGEGYHGMGRHFFASATWIRSMLRNGNQTPCETGAIPAPAVAVLDREIRSGRCLTSLDAFWRILGTVLVREKRSALAGYAEMREGIENLLAEKARESLSFDSFANACTSRRYPKSRIQRHAVHVLLGFEHIANRRAQREGPPYIRVLGLDSKGRELLRRMRSETRAPVIFRPQGFPGSYQREIADLEYRASRIWENLVPSPDPLMEFRSPPVRLG
jgi:predicted nucleotidyltransferase